MLYLLCAGAFAQNSSDQIAWVNWESAVQRQASNGKTILLYIYTDWCALCKRTGTECWTEPNLAEYVNANFIPVRLNAESKAPIDYRGKTYEYTREGDIGYHGFVAQLMEGRLSFPGLIFLGANQELIQSFTGYQSPAQMERLLTYYGEGHFRHTPWSTYERNYQLQLIAE